MGWKGRYGFEENNYWGEKAGKYSKRIMSGMERKLQIEDNNEWGGKAGMDMKRIMSGVERQVWL
jgi:hypothetical protein